MISNTTLSLLWGLTPCPGRTFSADLHAMPRCSQIPTDIPCGGMALWLRVVGLIRGLDNKRRTSLLPL